MTWVLIWMSLLFILYANERQAQIISLAQTLYLWCVILRPWGEQGQVVLQGIRTAHCTAQACRRVLQSSCWCWSYVLEPGAC